MDEHKFGLRETRDALTDQLSLVRTYPVTNMPVWPEQEIVSNNNYTHIFIDYSQPGVHYELYNNENNKVGEGDGNGDTISIKTNVLTNEDYTFNVRATKVAFSEQPVAKGTVAIIISSSQLDVFYEVFNGDNTKVGEKMGTGAAIEVSIGKPADKDNIFKIKASAYGNRLIKTVTVKVGIDAGLDVSLQQPVIDYNTTAVVIVKKAQSNTSYQVFDLQDTSLGPAVDSGPGGDIYLETTARIKEDTTVKVQVKNIKTGLGGELLMKREIQVRPDISLLPVVKAPAAYNTAGIVRLDNTQLTAGYQLIFKDIDDDAADKAQLKDTPVGAAVAGTGGTIESSTVPLKEDMTVAVVAIKTASGIRGELPDRIFIPVKPDPNKTLSLVKDNTASGRTTAISSVTPGGSAAIKVVNTQKGVLYQLRAGNNDIGMPGYHHKNYGIGKARIGIEFAVDTFTDDSVYLPTGPLQQTTVFSILAKKATTGQEAAIAGVISVVVK